MSGNNEGLDASACFLYADDDARVACLSNLTCSADVGSVYSASVFEHLWSATVCALHNATYGHRVFLRSGFEPCTVPLEGKDAFLFVALAIVVGALAFGKLAAVYSLLFGSLLALWSWGVDLRELSNALAIWIDVTPPDLLYYAFLPPLLVDGAMRLDWRVFRRVSVHVVLTAVVMVLLTALTLTPIVLYVLPFADRGWSWVHGALLASMLAATDAIAATAILKQGGGPERLVVLLEGEAMLNDASGITLFAAFFKLFEQHETPSEPFPTVWDALPGIIGSIARLAGVGLGVGLGIAVVHGALLALLRRRRSPSSDASVEAALALGMAYLAFYVANGPAGGSGVIAVVVMGLWGAATSRWSAPAEGGGGGGAQADAGLDDGWARPLSGFANAPDAEGKPLSGFADAPGAEEKPRGGSRDGSPSASPYSSRSASRSASRRVRIADPPGRGVAAAPEGSSVGGDQGGGADLASAAPRARVSSPVCARAPAGDEALEDVALLGGGRTRAPDAPTSLPPLPSAPAVHADPFLAAWDAIALAANGIAFAWTGIVCVTTIIRASKALGHSPWSYGGAFLVYAISHALRFLLVRLFTPFFVLCEEPLSVRETLFVTWAGLRGVVSSIMVLDVAGASHFQRSADLQAARRQEAALLGDATASQYLEEDRAALELVLWTSIFVLLTLFINAPLLGPVMKALKLGDALGGAAGRRARARAGREMRKETKRVVERLSGQRRGAGGRWRPRDRGLRGGAAQNGAAPDGTPIPDAPGDVPAAREFRGADWEGVLEYVRGVVASVPGFGEHGETEGEREADGGGRGLVKEGEGGRGEASASRDGDRAAGHGTGSREDLELRLGKSPGAALAPHRDDGRPVALAPGTAPPPSRLFPSPSRSALPPLFFSRGDVDPRAALIEGAVRSHHAAPSAPALAEVVAGPHPPQGDRRSEPRAPPADPFLPPPRPRRTPITLWVLLGFPPREDDEESGEQGEPLSPSPRAVGAAAPTARSSPLRFDPPHASPPPASDSPAASSPAHPPPSADEVRRRALSALQSLVRARRSRGEMSVACARAIGEAVAEVLDVLEKREHVDAKRAARWAANGGASPRPRRQGRWDPSLSVWNHLMWRSLQLGLVGRIAHAIAVACEVAAERIAGERPSGSAGRRGGADDASSMASSARCSPSGTSFADGSAPSSSATAPESGVAHAVGLHASSALGSHPSLRASSAPGPHPVPTAGPSLEPLSSALRPVARLAALPFSLLGGVFRAPYGGLSLLACESASEVALLARQVARGLEEESGGRGKAGRLGRASTASSATSEAGDAEAAAELRTLRFAAAAELRAEADRAEAFLAALSAWDPALLEAVQSSRAARRVVDALLGWTESAEIAGRVDEAEAADARSTLLAAKRTLEVDGWTRPERARRGAHRGGRRRRWAWGWDWRRKEAARSAEGGVELTGAQGDGGAVGAASRRSDDGAGGAVLAQSNGGAVGTAPARASGSRARDDLAWGGAASAGHAVAGSVATGDRAWAESVANGGADGVAEQDALERGLSSR